MGGGGVPPYFSQMVYKGYTREDPPLTGPTKIGWAKYPFWGMAPPYKEWGWGGRGGVPPRRSPKVPPTPILGGPYSGLSMDWSPQGGLSMGGRRRPPMIPPNPLFGGWGVGRQDAGESGTHLTNP